MHKQLVKRVIVGVTIVLLASAMVIAMSGCSVTVNFKIDTITGKVVDARSGGGSPSGIDDVKVKLDPIETSVDEPETLETTTDDEGEYSLEDVPSGTYNLTASKSGWYFPPQKVTVGGWDQELPDASGVELRDKDEYGISFILMWSNSDDLDLHTTFPTTNLSDDTDDESVFDTPTSTWATNWDNGFGPSTTNDRSDVYHDKTNSDYEYDNNPAVELDRDDTDGYGPETSTLRTIPFDYTTSVYPISPTDKNGLKDMDSDVNYRWMGVAQVYIKGTKADISKEDGSGPQPFIAAFQTQKKSGSLEAKNLGIFPIPDYINLDKISVIRINMFVDSSEDGYEWFQLIPNISTAVDIRDANQDVIWVKGRKRF